MHGRKDSKQFGYCVLLPLSRMFGSDAGVAQDETCEYVAARYGFAVIKSIRPKLNAAEYHAAAPWYPASQHGPRIALLIQINVEVLRLYPYAADHGYVAAHQLDVSH